MSAAVKVLRGGGNEGRKKGVKVGTVNGNKLNVGIKRAKSLLIDAIAVSKHISEPLVHSTADTWSDAQTRCFKSGRTIHIKPTNRPKRKKKESIEARLQNIQIPSDLDKFS